MLKPNDTSTPVEPVSADELEKLFAPIAEEHAIGLAVSGGADSTALMALAAGWARERETPPKLVVLTVDHQLRAGSADEARQVGDQAAALGLKHETLVWSGEKPASDIQAAAREARYRLLSARARELGLRVVLTAHHLDDQAETFLMRLARGSGVYGLAAMPKERSVAGVRLVRPLISVPQARLEATLRQAGLSWIDDPSNRDTRFARVRMRDVMPVLSEEGLTAERLAATAGRLRRAAAALDGEAGKILSNNTIVHSGGFAGFSIAALSDVADEIGLRVVTRLLMAVGGGDYAPRLERLEALFAEFARSRCGTSPVKRTLSGVVIEEKATRFWFYREEGRAGTTALALAPGSSAVWDRRFDVGLSEVAGDGVVVRPLGREGRRQLGDSCRGDWPHSAVATVPAAWRDDDLLAVPAFGFVADSMEPGQFDAAWRREFELKRASAADDG